MAEDVCAVCMEPFTTSGESAELAITPCAHRFHAKCMREWVSHAHGRVPRCPICRTHMPSFQEPTEQESYESLEARLNRLLEIRESVMGANADNASRTAPVASVLLRAETGAAPMSLERRARARNRAAASLVLWGRAGAPTLTPPRTTVSGGGVVYNRNVHRGTGSLSPLARPTGTLPSMSEVSRYLRR